MESLAVGRARLTWLDGGVTHLDGGAMFGVVPKPLWSKFYPHNEKNQIELRTDPILLEIESRKYLIESGIGNGKMTEKQKRNYGVTEESKVEASLSVLGYKPEDIDAVLMTHLHFDHACGLTKWEAGRLVPAFPNAAIYVNETEWNEMRHPNIRSVNTYWKDNWEAIQDCVKTYKKEIRVTEGLSLVHTGGHSDGHAIVRFKDGNDSFIHMADIMPTHAHQNVLWVLAYDDFPVTSVFQKQNWMEKGISDGAWYTFYHDAIFRAVKFDNQGNRTGEIKREKNPY